MRRRSLPMSDKLMARRLVSWGKKIPQAAELAPHVVIRGIRKALHMTQAQLAARAGLPQSHLAKIESGGVDVQWSTLGRILRAMNCEAVLVPKFTKEPEAAVRERIREVARGKVARATGSMARERQEPEERMIGLLLRSEEDRMRQGPSSEIWRDARAPGGASVVNDQPAVESRRARTAVRMVDKEDDRDILRFWLGQPASARIDAMEFLRRQTYLTKGKKALPRLQRSIEARSRP